VRAQFLDYIPADVPRRCRPASIHLHNVYLQYAADRRIPALIVFLWFLGKMLWDLARASRRTGSSWRDRRHAGGAGAGWCEHNLGSGRRSSLFLAVCACG
jgi:hypothetical protein